MYYFSLIKSKELSEGTWKRSRNEPYVIINLKHSRTFAIIHNSNPLASGLDAVIPLPSTFPSPNVTGVES